MIFDWWHDYLYLPLLNILMYLYQTVARENMGWAVVSLTVGLRVLLLPLNIMSERNEHRYQKVQAMVTDIKKDPKLGPVEKKQQVRSLLKKYRMSPVAKVLSLALQALVFILLYQVFVGGLKYAEFYELYAWVPRPEFVNTKFFGFDLIAHNAWWALAVGIFLYVEIWLVQRRHKEVDRGELIYRVAFPLFTALALFALPMVKSLFIMTTMLFSFIFFGLWKVRKPEES